MYFERIANTFRIQNISMHDKTRTNRSNDDIELAQRLLILFSFLVHIGGTVLYVLLGFVML